MEPDLKRIIVISGGSSGIGRELIKNFSAAGFTAISLSRTNPDNYGHFIECDVSSELSVICAVEQIKIRYKKIDILICNAGLGVSGATELVDIKDVKTVIDTDYYGSLYLARLALPLMQNKTSKLVFISSACALFPLPFRGVYCAAKAAVNMLSYSLRMELAPSQIPVVTICPGDIKSNFSKSRIKDYKTNERYGERIKNAAEKIDSREDKRYSVEKASKKIYKISRNKNGPLYIVGAKYKVFYFFQKILPVRLFNYIIGKMFGGREEG